MSTHTMHTAPVLVDLTKPGIVLLHLSSLHRLCCTTMVETFVLCTPVQCSALCTVLLMYLVLMYLVLLYSKYQMVHLILSVLHFGKVLLPKIITVWRQTQVKWHSNMYYWISQICTTGLLVECRFSTQQSYVATGIRLINFA